MAGPTRSPRARLPRSLRLTVAIVVIVAMAVLLLAVALWPPYPALASWSALFFWVAVIAVASAAPVRLPGGLMVNVSTAPLVAVSVIGGPGVAAVMAAIGTTEWREIRGLVPGLGGRVPWYGTLYNHASAVIPTVLGGIAYRALTGGMALSPDVWTLLVVLLVTLVFTITNYALTSTTTAMLEGRRPGQVFIANLRQSAVGLIGLAPFAWGMAVLYVIAGPIGVIPFILPLFATRDGYRKVVEIRDMFTQTVRSLASAVDAKDPYTAGHSVRVQAISRDLGAELRANDRQLEALEWGGLLHDIGKIGVPDAILLKQGRLTDEERALMNLHPVKGEEIIRPVEKLAPELPVIRHHHEWFDGSGYPDKLAGEQIPWLARIVHVADSFEAMTAARPYRMTPLTEAEAIAELHKWAGRQFDPQVVAAFERVLARRPAWSQADAPRVVPQRAIPSLGQDQPATT